MVASNRERLNKIVANMHDRKTLIPAEKFAVAVERLKPEPSSLMLDLFDRIGGSDTANRKGCNCCAPSSRQEQVVQKIRRRREAINPEDIAKLLEEMEVVPSNRILGLFESFSKDGLLVRLASSYLSCFASKTVDRVNRGHDRYPNRNHHPETIIGTQQHRVPLAHAPTVVSILIDASSSMKPIWADVVQSVNAHVLDISRRPTKHRVSMTIFDKKRHSVYRFLPAWWARRVPTYTGLGNGTALYDTLAMEIQDQLRFRQVNPHYENSVILVYSDGQDNKSEKWCIHEVRRLVQHALKSGFTITFVCRTEEADQVAERIGAEIATECDDGSVIQVATISATGFTYWG